MKNGVDDDPPVFLYIMGTGDDRRSAAGRLQHGGFWRQSANGRWPGRGHAFYLTRRRHARDHRRARPSSTHDLHVRPPSPRTDDRRQHLLEPGADDERRLRSAAARRHPRRR